MFRVIIYLVGILTVFLLESSTLRSVVGYLYLGQYLSFILLTNKANVQKKLTPYLKPSFLIVTYICLYFGLGSLYLNAGHGLFREMVFIYESATNFALINVFFLLCNEIVFEIGKRVQKKYNNQVVNRRILSSRINIVTVCLSVVTFILFSAVELDFAFLGGQGSFSYIPKLVSAIFLLLYLSFNRIRLRYIYYLILLLAFAYTSFESKREIIFVFILIVYIENLYNQISFKINLKSFLIGFAGVSVFTFFILISSINRGYGGYNPNNIFDAIEYVPDYVSSDIFLDALGDNFELNVVYGNALNSADIYLSGKQETLYGESFFKAIFAPIPRTVFDYKPRSMIQIYSPMVNDGHSVDVSYPVIIYSELLWNFGLFSLLGLVFLIYIIEISYQEGLRKIKNNILNNSTVLGLTFYAIFMQFIRGSGLDLLLIYLCLAFLFIAVIMFINRIFSKKNSLQ